MASYMQEKNRFYKLIESTIKAAMPNGITAEEVSYYVTRQTGFSDLMVRKELKALLKLHYVVEEDGLLKWGL